MYRSLRQVVTDCEKHGRLVRCDDEVDANLEAAEIQRRVHASGGPAVLFTRVRDCRFPLLANLFGTLERARFLFRHTWSSVERLIELRVDPRRALRQPTRYWRAPFTALRMRPKFTRRAAVAEKQCPLSQLPRVKCWPEDGGAFITLPQVYTEDAERPGVEHSNLGMYRVQLNGGQYAPEQEIGLHYQIHRGIGVHHRAALRAGKPFRVNIFLGGAPAMTLAAVMPLPEGLSELTFAGALAGHRVPLWAPPGKLPVYADADFCLVGTVIPDKQLPEGPFGDHLGYYSLTHDFPVLRVENVYHRADAIWPFTVVGRPPQEDTTFGQLIHELTGPIIPTVVHGVRAVHAVDAAGVHPLLLAIGSERYMPFYETKRPMELLTQAHALLGQGQLSLAKYLLIVNGDDDPRLDASDIPAFFQHLLRRVDWRRDLHFHTQTTIDTLDYTGTGLNAGSKLVIAAVGPPVRELPTETPGDLRLPEGFDDPRICLPGVLAVRAPRYAPRPSNAPSGATDPALERFLRETPATGALNRFPLVVLVDDSEFTARALNNFLWVAFTRSNPASDARGIEEFTEHKHWGCRGALVLDARVKPWHAPPLIEDSKTRRKIDALAARGGPLAPFL